MANNFFLRYDKSHATQFTSIVGFIVKKFLLKGDKANKNTHVAVPVWVHQQKIDSHPDRSSVQNDVILSENEYKTKLKSSLA